MVIWSIETIVLMAVLEEECWIFGARSAKLGEWENEAVNVRYES
jgi:hypothetical protein